MDDEPEVASTSVQPGGSAVYFDGKSSRRRLVTLAFRDQLELHEPPEMATKWSYDDIRRVDSPSHTLRVSCLTAPALARLEIRDAAVAAELAARCTRLDENIPRWGNHRLVAGSGG